MASDNDIATMVEQLRAIFKSGFHLGSSDCHFLESACAVYGPHDLAELIETNDSESETVLALVISPDEEIQTSFESLLQSACFLKTDITLIAKHATVKGLKTKIMFPGENGQVTVNITCNIVERFITKLRIADNPPESLYEAADTLSETNRFKALIRLRNATPDFNESVNLFISDLFYQEQKFRTPFLPLLDYAISILEENRSADTVNAAGIMQYFIKKLHFYAKTLETLTEVETKLRTSAVETMMMQGTRMPPVSREAVSSKIQMTEEVLAVLFGYIDSPAAQPSEVDLGHVTDKKEIHKIFRILS